MQLTLKNLCEPPPAREVVFAPVKELASALGFETIDDAKPFFQNDQQISWLGNEQPEVVLDDENCTLDSAPQFLSTTVILNFMSEAIANFETDGIKLALRSIYRNCRLMIMMNMVEEIDSEIAAMDFSNTDTDLLLGLLTATLPRKSELNNRKQLYKETKRLLKKRGQFERGILDGLQ